MFDRTQYVIEMTLGGRLVPFSRDTYSVMDTHGNLLGYAKKQRLKLWPRFWFEGMDGTRTGEIRSSKKGYEVYDAQNHLQATIKQKNAVSQQEEKRLAWDYPIYWRSAYRNIRVHRLRRDNTTHY
jgi:hypothetical protein